LEYESQVIRKHCRAQRAGESGDLEIRAKISWQNYVYEDIEDVHKTIRYDTEDNRSYDFSRRELVTAQLHPFKLEIFRVSIPKELTQWRETPIINAY
jgi:hypothetical protein